MIMIKVERKITEKSKKAVDSFFGSDWLVQGCGINGEYSTCLLRQHCVAVSQRWSRFAPSSALRRRKNQA